jgi:hypothetical protein
MARAISRRAAWFLVALAVIVLGIFGPPLLNVNRYRSQVATSIGNALGREVTVSNIELKMMPRPGMVLSGFVVADAPTFGAEPMLRADTVTAYLRLSSLWRGRLEIGTLSLDAPSLNLVRRDDGHWNLEDLVERASRAQPAPTATATPQARPRFPYIEANTGRINFKLGQVKKAFAFTDADFALWLESENEWGVRLDGRPMRTDVPVGETGTLRVEGTFQPASRLAETPIKLKVNYAKGQLGQITVLIYGRDRGWRGGASSTLTLGGTLSSLAVTMDARVDDFRRFDIAIGEALPLSTHCTGTYSSVDDSLRGIQCQAPVRPGILMVRGDVVGWGRGGVNLGVTAEQVPLEKIVALARHTKKDLPPDLTATGTTDAVFTVHRDDDSPAVWAGGGHTSRFALQSKVLKEDLELGPLELAIAEPEMKPGAKRTKKPALLAAGGAEVSSLQVVVKPFAILLGALSPATASGTFGLGRYRIGVKGDAELSRLTTTARAMGIGTPALGLSGPAQIDLEIAGAWSGFAPPIPSGKLQIRNAIVEMPGVLEPLQVSSATVSLAEQLANLEPFQAEFKGGPTVTGTASFPIQCGVGDSCSVRFDLHSPELSLARLNQLLNSSLQNHPWYQLLTPSQVDSDALTKMQARGHLAIAHFAIGSLATSSLTTNLEMTGGTVSFKEVNADLLGGHHLGNWDADFSAKPPKFFGSGTLKKVSMAQLSGLMHDPWATGMLEGQYTLGLEGTTPAALQESITGSAHFDWTSGSLRHVALDGKANPFAFSVFGGDVAIRGGQLGCDACKLQSSGASYSVSGRVGFDRALDLRVERTDGTTYAISGTVEKPVVESSPVASAKTAVH